MNYYEILGIPPDAEPEEIRAAFRRLARRYHPDAGTGSSAEKFREISEAYETLGDANRRRVYDQDRRPGWVAIPVEYVRRPEPEPLRPRRPADFETLFDEFLRAFLRF
jgi:curved DNA-binding protein CbpA